MPNETLHEWCKAATRKIKYPPDQKRVYQELMGHLEDKCDQLREAGVPEEELAARAVAEMGSAEEIAPQLGAIHRPLWGYVYTAVKWIGIWTVAIALCALVVEWKWDFIHSSAFESYQYGDEDTYFTQTEDGDGRRIYYAQLQETAYSDGYWFTLTDVALWDPGWPGALYQNQELSTLHVRIRERHLLGAYESDFFSWVWARDNLGRKYDCGKNRFDKGALGIEYDMWLIDFQSEGVEWVELCYAIDGRSITFRIDLTEVGL